jgi:glycerol-3-phosphate acyltransferase PlsX
MKLGLDIMGGDYAPAEAIKGVSLFFQETNDTSIHLLLIGNGAMAAPYMPLLETYKGRYTWVEAPDIIDMHEHPTKAFKDKPNSSISVGFGLLHLNKADAFISVGNSGAVMVGAMYSVKTIEGILRPTVVSPVPRIDGSFNLLLDVGINADCKPEHLVQFAQLGSLYAKHVYGIDKPAVGLLNIGEEEGKGNLLAQATYPLLKEDTGIHFAGNVEGRDIFLDKANVIVCEGFVGNVILKLAESMYHLFKEERKVSDTFLDQFNYEVYGGLPVLGLNKPVMIGHGISSANAFKNIIRATGKMVSSNVIDAFKKHFSPAVA